MEFNDIKNDIEQLNESIDDNEQVLESNQKEVRRLLNEKADLEEQYLQAQIYGGDIKEIKEKIAQKEKEIKHVVNVSKDRKKELDVLKKDVKKNMIELRNNSKDIENKKETFEQYEALINNNPDLQDIIKEMCEKQGEIKELEDKIDGLGLVGNAILQQHRAPLENRQIELKSAKSKFIKLAQGKLDELPKDKKKEFVKFLQQQVEQIGQEGNIVVNDDKIDMQFVQDSIDKLDGEISERESIVTEYEKENNVDLSLESQEKPKWYQFIKNFKQWRENKEIKALPEVKNIDKKDEAKDEQPIMGNIEQEEKTNSFLEGLKFVKEAKTKVTGYVKDINMHFRSKGKIKFRTRDLSSKQPESRPVFNPSDLEMEERE